MHHCKQAVYLTSSEGSQAALLSIVQLLTLQAPLLLAPESLASKQSTENRPPAAADRLSFIEKGVVTHQLGGVDDAKTLSVEPIFHTLAR